MPATHDADDALAADAAAAFARGDEALGSRLLDQWVAKVLVPHAMANVHKFVFRSMLSELEDIRAESLLRALQSMRRGYAVKVRMLPVIYKRAAEDVCRRRGPAHDDVHERYDLAARDTQGDLAIGMELRALADEWETHGKRRAGWAGVIRARLLGADSHAVAAELLGEPEGTIRRRWKELTEWIAEERPDLRDLVDDPAWEEGTDG